ncbi:hypothetical protein GCM10027051_31460 [Niabella terrae]
MLLLYTEALIQEIRQPDSDVYGLIEKRFNNWISRQPGSIFLEMYFGPDHAYCKVRAIWAAIDHALAKADEQGQPVDLETMDFETVFNGK